VLLDPAQRAKVKLQRHCHHYPPDQHRHRQVDLGHLGGDGLEQPGCQMAKGDACDDGQRHPDAEVALEERSYAALRLGGPDVSRHVDVLSRGSGDAPPGGLEASGGRRRRRPHGVASDVRLPPAHASGGLLQPLQTRRRGLLGFHTNDRRQTGIDGAVLFQNRMLDLVCLQCSGTPHCQHQLS